MKLENHIDVYVDARGRVCMAQPSMEEECSVSLEPEEVKSLITLLTSALDEAVGMRVKKSSVNVATEKAVPLKI
jgi:hypothetical protein